MDNQLLLNREYELRLIAILMAALLIILTASFVLGAKVERGDNSRPTETARAAFAAPPVEAKALYVYDIRHKKVLFAKNEKEKLPLASLTKIMTALVALEKGPGYNTVTISEESLKPDGDNGLIIGETWSLSSLLDFSLVTSSNDGMRAVALSLGALSKASATTEEIIKDFVREMNEKAKKLNLENTYFLNETGLDQSDVNAGAYGSAEDINNLVEYILTNHPELFEATQTGGLFITSLSGRQHRAVNTNDISHLIPGLKASKTGFTTTAGGNLTVAFDPELGRPFIITVLGSSEQGRFADVEALVGAVMEYIQQ